MQIPAQKEEEPIKDKTDIMKCCLDIEKAHWSYSDDPDLQNKGMAEISFEKFAEQAFQHVKYLNSRDLNATLKEFRLYKRSIPTCGAVLLSPGRTHVLLLQTRCSEGLWGFPKGKLENDESPLQCAIREVYEETSVDIKTLINSERCIEGEWSNSSGSGFTTLYVVENVSMRTKLAPRTIGEIQCCEWFPLNELFDAKRGANGRNCFKVTANAFYMTRRLQRFLSKNLGNNRNTTQFRNNSRERRYYNRW
ncbi:hypothetical protein HA402_007509 [Bradysia odoriphaga]|nr:hypothetical protein HA402_007509 [Bradysia odoriphaga]